MNDDDNYTIDEPDEPDVPFAEEPDGVEAAPIAGAAAARWLLVAGLVTIVAAALCATVQANFQEGAPGRGTFFVTALTLPLSITGALLVVVAVCVLALRPRLPRRDG